MENEVIYEKWKVMTTSHPSVINCNRPIVRYILHIREIVFTTPKYEWTNDRCAIDIVAKENARVMGKKREFLKRSS